MNKENFNAELTKLVYRGLQSESTITVRQMFDVLCEHEEMLRGEMYKRDMRATETAYNLKQGEWKTEPGTQTEFMTAPIQQPIWPGQGDLGWTTAPKQPPKTGWQ